MSSSQSQRRSNLIPHFATFLSAALFLLSAANKITAKEEISAYMEAYGVHSSLRWPAALFEIASGVCLLLRVQTALVSLVLAGWCVLTAVIFHVQWSDANELVHFLKNMALAGTFLLVADYGE